MILWSMLLDAVRGALFSLSHVLGGNLGFGIIGLSVIVRLALLPWGLKAARRSVAMRESLKALEPRIRELKDRYAAEPAKLRDAVMAEYQRAGVNPVAGSGLGLMAVQLPLGWALYTVIRTGLGSGNPFLWITNLARPDVALSLIVGSLSVALGMTMPSTSGPVTPMVMATIMGVASFLVVFHLSAGVALYWASSTGVGIFQNALLRRSLAAAG
jgi:YidC/Oxa1 family membrane protein insertase